VVGVLALAVLTWGLASCGTSGGGDTRDASGSTTLPTVALESLPVEARSTVVLIDAGGPFPYDRDGVVFGNFEKLLPAHGSGYYHEYTVPTPGASDRGARRIVVGRDGALYWTGDHYRSFERITR
jgi:ribonuclease T1